MKKMYLMSNNLPNRIFFLDTERAKCEMVIKRNESYLFLSGDNKGTYFELNDGRVALLNRQDDIDISKLSEDDKIEYLIGLEGSEHLFYKSFMKQKNINEESFNRLNHDNGLIEYKLKSKLQVSNKKYKVKIKSGEKITLEITMDTPLDINISKNIIEQMVKKHNNTKTEERRKRLEEARKNIKRFKNKEQNEKLILECIEEGMNKRQISEVLGFKGTRNLNKTYGHLFK